MPSNTPVMLRSARKGASRSTHGGTAGPASCSMRFPHTLLRRDDEKKVPRTSRSLPRDGDPDQAADAEGDAGGSEADAELAQAGKQHAAAGEERGAGADQERARRRWRPGWRRGRRRRRARNRARPERSRRPRTGRNEVPAAVQAEPPSSSGSMPSSSRTSVSSAVSLLAIRRAASAFACASGSPFAW